jgi:hypothetical protein
MPESSPISSSSNSTITLNTTAGSALHVIPRWLDSLGFGAFTPVVIYAGAVSLTFLPLIIGAGLSPLSMTIQSETLSLPFLYDVSTIFLYVVSFPCLLILTVTDHRVLSRALSRVQIDGILTISEVTGLALAERCYRRFRITNLVAQALGLAAGGITAYFVYRLNATATIKSWTESEGHLLAVGYIRLYCDFLFSFVAAVYVIRSIAVPILLWDIVAHAEFHMLPLHPDKAGGLRPIGRLGLRNQYAITLVGLNIGLGWLVSYLLLPDNAWKGFIVVAATAYLIFGPVVFVGPLLPFRDGMIRSKSQLMSGVALRMRLQLDDLRSRFQSGVITAEDEQMIERLRKIGAVIDDLPVWPFDTLTLRKFFTAYMIPIIGFSVPAMVKLLLSY